MDVQTVVWVAYATVVLTAPIVVSALVTRAVAKRIGTKTGSETVFGYEIGAYETDRTLVAVCVVVMLITWLGLWIGLGLVLQHFDLLP